MTDDGTELETTGGVRQPLPPEVPMPRPAEETPAPAHEAEGSEWWRNAAATPTADGTGQEAAGSVSQPLPPEVPRPRDGSAAPESAEASPEPGEGREWWDGDSVRGELRDAWNTQGAEAVAAAHEIGSYIGSAIADHLPDPHAAAAKRGLDIRWLHLKINLPAIALATLVTWGGQSTLDRMARAIATDGVLAPIGGVLLFALVLMALRVLPVGGMLFDAVAHLFTALVGGLITLVQRAWGAPGTGYLLRVLAATLLWAFVIALLFVGGRGAINFLTGV
ncbi:hypothetical protein ACFXAQ_32975 [Streptomyces olivaceus]|uniref:hypothetical protein n=1 Tax=Streptomyces olivaceus TaxID=47716 RepID=UPI0036CB03CE